jgi:uncharacterized membrane protein
MFNFSNLNLWLHILSAVVWVGAIFYTWWVLIPGVKSAYSHEEAPLRITILEKRFRKVAHPFIVLIAITGVINLMLPASLEKFKTSPTFGMLVTLKVILLAVLIFIHILRFVVYARRIESGAPGAKVPEEGLKAWNKSKTVLIIQALTGIILIFIGVSLRFG